MIGCRLVALLTDVSHIATRNHQHGNLIGPSGVLASQATYYNLIISSGSVSSQDAMFLANVLLRVAAYCGHVLELGRRFEWKKCSRVEYFAQAHAAKD